MPFQINIHGTVEHDRTTPALFMSADIPPLRGASNRVSLMFSGRSEVTLWDLTDTTADALHLLASMSEEQRAELLPAMRKIKEGIAA